MKLLNLFLLMTCFFIAVCGLHADVEMGFAEEDGFFPMEDFEVGEGESIFTEDEEKEDAEDSGEQRELRENHLIEKIEFRQSRVSDAVRLISEITGMNIITTSEAGDREVTIFLQKVTGQAALESICRVSDLWYRKSEYEPPTWRVVTLKEYQKDLKIFQKEEIEIFQLKFPNPKNAAIAIRDLFGDRVQLSFGLEPEDDLSPDGASSGGNENNTGTVFGNNNNNGNNNNTSRSFSSSGTSSRRPTIDEKSLTVEKIQKLEEGEELVETIELADIFVTVNNEHNLIVVRTSDAEAMKDIARLIENLDRPTPQVLLEMKILELQVGDDFRSVLDVRGAKGLENSGPPVGGTVNPLTSSALADEKLLSLGNFSPAGGTLIYQYINDTLRARIELFERDNRVSTVATPLILASNNREAKVFVGEQKVLVTGIDTNTTISEGETVTTIEPQTEIRDIGVILAIIPKINADDTVTLQIEQITSSISANSALLPVNTGGGSVSTFAVDTVSTSQMEGIIVAQDGLTIAIGGLVRNSVTDTVDKVPFLGDIPLLGKLFSRTIRSKTKTELILLIKPHIIQTPGEGAEISKEKMEALSRHGYHEKGDALYDDHFKSKK